jgi:chorismate mutase
MSRLQRSSVISVFNKVDEKVRKIFPAKEQRRKERKSFENVAALCAFAPLRENTS